MPSVSRTIDPWSVVRQFTNKINRFCLIFLLEFRGILEQFERLSCSIGKIELEQHMKQAEQSLHEAKQRFDSELIRKINQSNIENKKNYDLLRPTFGQPSRKNELEEIDQRERSRLVDIDQKIQHLRISTIVNNIFFL